MKKIYVVALIVIASMAKQAQGQIRFTRVYSSTNLRTTATCPTSPVALDGQDSLGNSINNGQTLVNNSIPFYVYVPPQVAGNIASPCIQTQYTNFHTDLATYATQTFYEGSAYQNCVGPGAGCAFPIGGGIATNNVPWGLTLSLLDPNQPHEFVFCRTGSITTTTVTLTDCWTGNILPSNPASTLFSNATTTVSGTCDTLTLPVNTDIGTASYSIAPASATVALIDYHNGEAYIHPTMLPTGTYTVTYNFSPPAADGCAAITGTFMFNIQTTGTCVPTVSYSLTADIVPHTWDAYPTYSPNVVSARWYWGDGKDTMALYPSHTYSVAGTYSICVAAYSSCGDSAVSCQNDAISRSGNNSPYSNMVQVNVLSSHTTGIKQVTSSNEVSIYPNPASSSLQVTLSGNIQNTTIEVYNTIGECVHRQIVSSSNSQIDVSGLQSGLYMVKIQTDEGTSIKKFIKE